MARESGRGADLPSLQCVDAPRAPASLSPAGACTVRPSGPHPAGLLSQAPPHLSPLRAERTAASRLGRLSSPHTSAPEPSVRSNPAPPRSVLVPGPPLAGVRAGRPPAGSPGRGPLTALPSPGTGFPFPASTVQHSGDGGGGAGLQLPFVSRGMAETRWPCWASPGGRAARGAGLFREPLALLWAGSFGARAERVGRGRPFQEESGPTGFCLQPEVGPVALQGARVSALPSNPSPAGVSPFLGLGPQSLPAASPLQCCLGSSFEVCFDKDRV